MSQTNRREDRSKRDRRDNASRSYHADSIAPRKQPQILPDVLWPRVHRLMPNQPLQIPIFGR